MSMVNIIILWNSEIGGKSPGAYYLFMVKVHYAESITVFRKLQKLTNTQYHSGFSPLMDTINPLLQEAPHEASLFTLVSHVHQLLIDVYQLCPSLPHYHVQNQTTVIELGNRVKYHFINFDKICNVCGEPH
ncbi:hypothetical protein HPG69_006643, partial [Diceros bicornis minor]